MNRLRNQCFALLFLLGLCTGCGSGSTHESFEGSLEASVLLTAPVQEQTAVIVELKTELYRSPGGRMDQPKTYCLLGKGAKLKTRQGTYVLQAVKDVVVHRDAPLFKSAFTASPYRISKSLPKTLPERFRSLPPEVMSYIDFLRNPSSGSRQVPVPYLSEVRLTEWYYPPGQRVRLRGTLRNDTLFFRPQSLSYAD